MGKRLPGSGHSLVPLVREMGASLRPSVAAGGAFLHLHANANTMFYVEWATRTDFLLVLALVAYLFCDTAYSTLETVTERLIAPFWHRAAERRPAATTSSVGLSRSLRQWLCTPSHNEKNRRLSRFIQISHNPPQFHPCLPTCG